MKLFPAHISRKKLCVYAVIIAFTAFCGRVAVSTYPGYGYDMSTHAGWGQSAMKWGIVKSYRRQVNRNLKPNHPPIAITMISLAERLFRAFPRPPDPIYDRTYGMFLKLPGILADVCICLLFLFFFWKEGKPNYGLCAALIYAFHPAAIFDSAIWGQTDAIFSCFLVAGLMMMYWKKWYWAGAMCAFALFSKPQALMLAPLFAFVLLLQPKSLLKFVPMFLLMIGLMILPFVIGGTAHKVLHVFTKSVSHFEQLSANAYNLWWGLYNGGVAWNTPDTDIAFAFVNYRTLGIGIFCSIYFIIIMLLRKPLQKNESPYPLFLAASLAAYAFFLFNTQMHERYLFPLIPLFVPLLFAGWRFVILYVISSTLFIMNLLALMRLFDFVAKFYNAHHDLGRYISIAQVITFFVMMIVTIPFVRKYSLNSK